MTDPSGSLINFDTPEKPLQGIISPLIPCPKIACSIEPNNPFDEVASSAETNNSDDPFEVVLRKAVNSKTQNEPTVPVWTKKEDYTFHYKKYTLPTTNKKETVLKNIDNDIINRTYNNEPERTDFKIKKNSVVNVPCDETFDNEPTRHNFRKKRNSLVDIGDGGQAYYDQEFEPSTTLNTSMQYRARFMEESMVLGGSHAYRKSGQFRRMNKSLSVNDLQNALNQSATITLEEIQREAKKINEMFSQVIKQNENEELIVDVEPPWEETSTSSEDEEGLPKLRLVNKYTRTSRETRIDIDDIKRRIRASSLERYEKPVSKSDDKLIKNIEEHVVNSDTVVIEQETPNSEEIKKTIAEKKIEPNIQALKNVELKLKKSKNDGVVKKGPLRALPLQGVAQTNKPNSPKQANTFASSNDSTCDKSISILHPVAASTPNKPNVKANNSKAQMNNVRGRTIDKVLSTRRSSSLNAQPTVSINKQTSPVIPKQKSFLLKKSMSRYSLIKPQSAPSATTGREILSQIKSSPQASTKPLRKLGGSNLKIRKPPNCESLLDKENRNSIRK